MCMVFVWICDMVISKYAIVIVGRYVCIWLMYSLDLYIILRQDIIDNKIGSIIYILNLDI